MELPNKMGKATTINMLTIFENRKGSKNTPSYGVESPHQTGFTVGEE